MTTPVPTATQIENYEQLLRAHLSRRESQSRELLLKRLTGRGTCPECGEYSDGDPRDVAAFNHAISQMLYRREIRMNEHREYELIDDE